MQSNRLSAYNTQVSSAQKKIETVEGKKAPKLAVVENGSKSTLTTDNCGNSPHASDFDFAGLAG